MITVKADDSFSFALPTREAFRLIVSSILKMEMKLSSIVPD